MMNGFAINQVELEETAKTLKYAKPKTLSDKLRVAQVERDLMKAQADMYQADAVRATLAINQTVEQYSADQHAMNPTVQRAADLHTHLSNPHIPHEDKKFFHAECRPHSQMKPRNMSADKIPIVTLNLSDAEVKRRTGYPTMASFLSYLLIVCDEDIILLEKHNSSLTWLEEWFMHFGYKWGRTTARIWDVSKEYGPNSRDVEMIISSKYSIELKARQRWPMYASYEEDKQLRKGKWNVKYANQRIVMWDMTNIDAYGFSDADLQRLTYSKYYNGNVFKGGVFTQLCGWIGTADLWPGGVSDTDYNRREGYLQRQENFANNDLVNETVLPFTNIYDKGYRAKMIAWKTGKQRVLQPVWAESDRRFGRNETLLTGSVATDRAGNERAVNVSKRAWFLSRGFAQNMSPKRMNDAWLTWCFQANFMFNPVL